MTKGQVAVACGVELWLAAVTGFALGRWAGDGGGTVATVGFIVFLILVPVGIGVFLWLWFGEQERRSVWFVAALAGPWLLAGLVMGLVYAPSYFGSEEEQQRTATQSASRSGQAEVEEEPCGWTEPLRSGASIPDDSVWIEQFEVEPYSSSLSSTGGVTLSGLVRNEGSQPVRLASLFMYYLSEAGERVGDHSCSGICVPEPRRLRPGYVADLSTIIADGPSNPIPSVATEDTVELYLRYCMDER